MKQLLTALLIAFLVFGCNPQYGESHLNDTKQKEREHDEVLDVVSDWVYDKCNEYFDKSIFLANASGNRDSIDKYNYFGRAMREVFMKVISLKYRNKKSPPKPSPLPDTSKPIKDKVKMQPRWRDSSSIILTDFGNTPAKDIGAVDTFYVDTSGNGFITKAQYDSFIAKVDYAYYPQNDTTKVIMLVSDTSSQNGFRSQRCFWMYGYVIQEQKVLLPSMPPYMTYNETVGYLDDRHLPLPKNIVVWMSKELK